MLKLTTLRIEVLQRPAKFTDEILLCVFQNCVACHPEFRNFRAVIPGKMQCNTFHCSRDAIHTDFILTDRLTNIYFEEESISEINEIYIATYEIRLKNRKLKIGE